MDGPGFSSFRPSLMNDQLDIHISEIFLKGPNKKYSLIKEFLSNHGNKTQRVCVNGNYSNFEMVTWGIHHHQTPNTHPPTHPGNVLRTTLFVIFMNDLPEFINTYCCETECDDSKPLGRVKAIEHVNHVGQFEQFSSLGRAVEYVFQFF